MTVRTVRSAIAGLLEGASLDEEEMAAVMEEIMGGEATPAQIGAFLALLRSKGETIDEIAGAARVMRSRATQVTVRREGVLDTCGTGGDSAGTFNISTAAGLVAAAAGCVVAKHGNRAISGKVGGADVLELLGIPIETDPERTARTIEEQGFGFLFAPRLHGAMKHAAGPRKELGVRTIFNLLGPLTNPAGAKHQLIGVFDPKWVEPLAAVLGRLGSVHAMVVHGDDGLDEITLTTTTTAAELRDGRVEALRIEPEMFGFHRCRPEDLRVADAEESAARIREILDGATGPAREVVLLNAGVAIYVADLVPTIPEGIERARRAIDEGRAGRLVDRLVEEK